MANPHPQIAIITDDPGWHGRELTTALHAHGLQARYVSLTDCQFCFDENNSMIRLPGFARQLPLGVFVRGVPGGTLEQVIFRLDILHALGNLGTVVYNDTRAIERTVDKAMTTLLLKQAELPTPTTWVLESADQARIICERELGNNRFVVLKPLFGSQGIGVTLIREISQLNHVEDFTGLYYLQRYINPVGTEWSDIRVFVINNKAVAAMRRRSQNWLTNRAQGASCEHLVITPELATLAESAAAALAIDYAGVDIIPDADSNLNVIEVNSIPAWWGLQSVTDFNIASHLVDHFVRRIGENHSMTVLS